jgi:hypothetical protein
MTRDGKVEALKLAGCRSAASVLDELEANGFTIYPLRSRSPRRAKNRSAKMTLMLVFRIERYRKRHPEKTQAEIAAHFNVNPGRVSEVLNGKWR